MAVEAPLLWQGAVVAVAASVTPIVMAWLNSAQKRRDKEQDWKRQDEVARRVAEAADQAAKAAVLLVDSNARLAENAKEVNGKLDSIGEQATTIHKLVNSNLTDAKQKELAAEERSLVLMEEVVALKVAQKLSPSPSALALIEAAKRTIAELRAQLADRLQAQKVIDANKLTVTMTLPK